jgi:hypothetical protein
MLEPILTPPNPADAEGAENLDEKGQPIIPAEPQIDWEQDTNPYRKRYTDSQSQIQPLVRTLQQFAEFDHNTKTWKPKAPLTPAQAEDFERVLEGYDPEFRKALDGYTDKKIKVALTEFQKESAFVSEFNSKMLAGRSKAMEDFGSEFDFAKDGKMNMQSPLYQLANEIVQNKYVVFNPDGTFNRYSTPDAEYLATVEAYAILSKRSKQPPQDKGKLGAIKGQTTGSAAVKKQLSYEEYNKLSDAEKDSYDSAQLGG